MGKEKHEVYFQEGISFFKAGNNDLAKDFLIKAKDSYENTIDWNHYLGRVYQKEMNLSAAVKYLDRAVDLGSKNATFALFDIYFDQRNYHDMLKLGNRMVKQFPDYVESFRYRGIAYAGLLEYERAKNDFLKSIDLDPDYHRTYRDLGSLYREQKKYDEALQYYKISDDKNKTDIKDHFADLARLHSDMKDYPKAIEYYKRSLAATSKDHHIVYVNMSHVYRAMDDFENAHKAINKSLEIKPTYPNAYLSLGNLYMEQKNYKDALTSFKKMVEYSPKNADGYYSVGTAYSSLKQYSKAIEYYNESLKWNPRDWMAYSAIGVSEFNRHNDDMEAIFGNFLKALHLNPSHKNSQDYINYYFRVLKDYYGASIYEENRDYFNDFFESYSQLLEKNGDYEKSKDIRAKIELLKKNSSIQ